ncbi:glycosyltransferase family 2 protein [Sphingomonas sp. HMP6]|uniref:glycosyltransferase family 2 protein n=1 Tax=Sphingomonas sp. HMP6 TaxID=1517551 RepID=UPI001E4850E3|nr:glycosyltransferase family A protein [Sphingomonas sp. HMP6]
MPCLDEAAFAGDAARSLLAPNVGRMSDLSLIAVDNGSTDGTLDVLANLAREFPGQVHIVEERRRGFVPARRRGVQEVVDLVRRSGTAENQALVLQADADTVYRPGYVPAMEAASDQVENAVLEGAAGRPAEFAAIHPTYILAERVVDAAMEDWEAVDQDDVVVDDKICAFKLSDYLRWGGLFEETDGIGDDIHAETTRMFIRARLMHGAKKVRVNPAGAASSRRRVMEDPRLHYATLGFPRTKSWREEFSRLKVPVDVDSFAASILEDGEREAVWLRSAHLLALFRYLPAYVLSAGCGRSTLLESQDVRSVLALLPAADAVGIAASPGRAIEAIFALIDRCPDLFIRRSVEGPGAGSI